MNVKCNQNLGLLAIAIAIFGQGCTSGFETVNTSLASSETNSVRGGVNPQPLAPTPAPSPAPGSPATLPPVSTPPSELAISPQVLGAGTHHSCALSAGFKAYCWGRGWEGQVGDPAKQNHSSPFLVSDSLQFKIIRTGTQFTCGATLDNHVYCWGDNSRGNLGTGDTGIRAVPTLVQGLPSGAQIQDLGASNPFNLYTEHIQLAMVPLFACALLTNGEVWCWGDNRLGTLAKPLSTEMSAVPVKILDGAMDLSVGAGHACAVKASDHRVYCWGDNHAGELAGATPDQSSPTPMLISQLGRVINVRAGGAFSCVTDEAKRVQCWGRNAWSTLGRGNSPGNEDVPAEPLGVGEVTHLYVGTSNVCTLDAQKQAKCWGDNYVGQLGTGVSGGNQNTPTILNSIAEPIEEMTMGNFSMCALLSTKKMKCWGHAYFGEAGNGVDGGGAPSPVEVVNYLWK